VKINVLGREPTKLANSCRIVGVYEDGKLLGAAATIDKASNGAITRQIEHGDFTGSHSQTALLHDVKGAKCDRILLVLLVGFGKRGLLDAKRWRSAIQAMSKALIATKTLTALSDIPFSIKATELNAIDACEQLARLLFAQSYRFNGHPREKPTPASSLEQLSIIAPAKQKIAAERAAERGFATATGMALTRDLGNLAPNICTPIYLEMAAQDLDTEFDRVRASALNEDAMEELGMGAFLSVSPARLIMMEYQGRKKAGKPIVLVGKGVTFDTGGISIKPSDSMDEMKYDMCGAATVFGVMRAVATLDLDINVIGVVAAAESWPQLRTCPTERPAVQVMSLQRCQGKV